MQTKNLAQWLTHIQSFHPNEIALGLDRITQVAQRLNLLEQTAGVITVAGTNGKGSTVAGLEAAALSQNLNVGAYTSPHILRFNERIKINGQEVVDEQLIKAFEQIESARGEILLTFFEFTTLAALWVFKSLSLDLVILEVGLGGRLDAVNIIESDIAIITTVDYDHADWLGNDINQITAEKAGVIRPNKAAFIGDSKTLKLVKKVLPKHPKLNLVEPANVTEKQLIASFATNPYQLLEQNLMLAKAAFNCLMTQQGHHCNITKPLELSSILSHIRLAGRFQKVHDKPPIIVDVGHNPQAARNLGAQLERYKNQFSIRQVSAVCGMMTDKAIKEVLTELNHLVDNWAFIDLPPPRGSSGQALATIYAQAFPEQSTSAAIGTYNSIELAFEDLAVKVQGFGQHDSLILVFGSFITVQYMLEYQQVSLSDSVLKQGESGFGK
ncbi:bifunctional folylpolyglutamate synthase/dihydrofolate synthase [Aliikangiella sp. IMCC44632]